MRTGVMKVRIFEMPAQVLRKVAIGQEFMARAVSSATESQHVELRPSTKVNFFWTFGSNSTKRDT